LNSDSEGGVSTAEDEAITEYTRVLCTGTRTIAVDKFNDIWVGGHDDSSRIHLKVNGLTGSIVPNSAFNAGIGGYGGVIDGLGNLWSSESGGGSLLWLIPPTNYPPQRGTNWFVLTEWGADMYGIAVDPVHPNIWSASDSYVFRWTTNGAPDTNADGSLKTFFDGNGGRKGLAVDANGHVWAAHAEGSTTVGHVNTNGTWLGDVNLQVTNLFAEYFNNTNLNGWPVLTHGEGPVNFSWTNHWPGSPIPTNQFSARWSGIVSPQAQGDHVFYVSAEAGAAFRLTVNGAVIIDHWTNPVPVAVELAGTNWLGTNVSYDIKLEYVHFTNGAQITLSWQEPGMTKQIIPAQAFTNSSIGPTRISIDSAGKVWAGCLNSSTAVRIDPNAGALTNVDGATNRVGLVDMVVNLGDGSASDPHQPPYNIAASPYNYSDMTGFNERVVNPAMIPLKGYWTVIDDSGTVDEIWKYVSWNAFVTNGCSIEVYVRVNNDRQALASEAFVPATNNMTLIPQVQGRFIEVRLAMTRDDATNQPVVYDLTLHGSSSGFDTNSWLDDASAYETQDAVFSPTSLAGAGPFTYQ
jgi:PA14 domain